MWESHCELIRRRVIQRFLNVTLSRFVHQCVERVVTMLDTFEILTSSGVVLWSRTFAPVNPSIINTFISDVFIEERSSIGSAREGASAAKTAPYRFDQHTLKWTFVKELGIIFVVCLRSTSSRAAG